MAERSKKFVHEGKYAAEVAVELVEDESGWSPYLTAVDVQRLDEVRRALRDGDLQAASKLGRIFELTPLSS